MKINSRFGCSTEVYRAGFRSVREAVEAVSFVTDECMGRMKRVLATEVDDQSSCALVSARGALLTETAQPPESFPKLASSPDQTFL